MKLNKKYKIEKAVSTNSARYQLGFVHIDTEKKELIATTGSILAKVPIELDKDDKLGSKSITPDVLQIARRIDRKDDVLEIGLNDTFTLKDGSTFKRPKSEDVGQFPNYRQIIPKNPLIKHKVTINPKLFQNLCDAIGAVDSVTLEFQAQNGDRAIIVRSKEGYGLIMPLRHGN